MFLKNHTSHFSASWRIRRDKLQAFTLIELLVVIVIIGILATLATVALTSSRANARDARRISDLKQISTALELYQADNNAYPSTITFGSALVGTGNKTYMAKVPTNPTPRAEGPCADTEYSYSGNTSDYSLIGCLAKGTGDAPVGARLLSVAGARNLGPTNGIVAWWTLEDTYTNGNLLKDALSGNAFATSTGATLTANQLGIGNKAYSLTSTNNINMPFQSVVNSTSDFTVSFWHKKSVNQASHRWIFWNQTSESNIVGLMIYTTNDNNTLIFFKYDGSQTTKNCLCGRDNWCHLVAKQEAGVFTVKKNNVTCGPAGYGALGIPGLPQNNLTTKLYSPGDTGVNSFSDFRVYNRALSDTEITTLWTATKQ